MKTITFYAYKGGTGRSLVVANAAKYLAGFGQNVFVIDFDLEAPGLHYKLSDADDPLPVENGVVDFFHVYKDSQSLPESLALFQVRVPLPPGTTGSIRLMPAGPAPSAAYWRKLASLNWHEFFYQPSSVQPASRKQGPASGAGHGGRRGADVARDERTCCRAVSRPPYCPDRRSPTA